MAADGITATVKGLPDLRKALRSIPDKLRRRVLRNALAAGGRVLRDAARRIYKSRRRPGQRRLRPTVSVQTSPYRKHGTIDRAISVRTSKIARRQGDVGVFINVKPLSRGKQSAKNPNDPFYWRWMEFGKRGYDGVEFLQGAGKFLSTALSIFTDKMSKQIAKLNGGKDVQL